MNVKIHSANGEGSGILGSSRGGEAVGQRPDVGGVASAAAPEIPDALVSRGATEVCEFGSGYLNGLQVIWKGRLAGEAMAGVGGAKCGGLGGDGNR